MDKSSKFNIRKVTFLSRTIIAILAVFVLVDRNSYHFPSSVIDGYPIKPDYSQGDTAFIILNTGTNLKRQVVRLFDLKGNVIDSVIASPEDNKLKIRYIVPKQLKGIYYFENKVPLIIVDPDRELTIVYPYLNEQANSNYGGASFYSYNSALGKPANSISIHRPITASHQYRKFLKTMNDDYRIQVISEASLEQKNLQSRLIVLLGNYPFLSEKMNATLLSHLAAGKHIVIIGSYAGEEKIEYDPVNYQLTRTSSPLTLVPFISKNYTLKGKDTVVVFNLRPKTELNPDSETQILTLNIDFIRGSDLLYNCILSSKKDSLNLLACANFATSEGSTGVFKYTHPSGGKLFYFATNGWATNSNYEEKNVRIIKNLVQSVLGKDKQATR